jgi:hypothetical protein
MVARRVKRPSSFSVGTRPKLSSTRTTNARDAMKYLMMSQSEPSRKSLERRVTERVQTVREHAKRQGVTDQAATMAVLNYTKIMHSRKSRKTTTVTKIHARGNRGALSRMVTNDPKI